MCSFFFTSRRNKREDRTGLEWLTDLIRDLHFFRGYEPADETGFIMGHEFTGIVKEVGKEVKTVKVGDKIVTPFTVSWCVNIQLIHL
jgi:hypothetical protein